MQLPWHNKRVWRNTQTLDFSSCLSSLSVLSLSLRAILTKDVPSWEWMAFAKSKFRIYLFCPTYLLGQGTFPFYCIPHGKRQLCHNKIPNSFTLFCNALQIFNQIWICWKVIDDQIKVLNILTPIVISSACVLRRDTESSTKKTKKQIEMISHSSCHSNRPVRYK